MIPQNILLYHTKMQGYVLRNNTYGTNIEQAKRFTEPEAIAYAQRALPGEGLGPLIPVALDILNSIRPVS